MLGARSYLSVFEDGLGPVEQQQPDVAVFEGEVILQDLQHVDAGPHGQRGVPAERTQPGQEVVRSHVTVPERARMENNSGQWCTVERRVFTWVCEKRPGNSVWIVLRFFCLFFHLSRSEEVVSKKI